MVGWGVSQSELVRYAQNLALESGEGQTSPSPYKGGEIRSDKGGDWAFVAIAGQGGALKDAKEALAFAVLQRALGTGPQIKWGSRDNGLLSKCLGGNIGDESAIAALNVSYSDAGLFGALIAAPAESAGKLVEAAAGVLKGGQVGDDDVNRGKNQLKAAVLLENEGGSEAIGWLGTQAALLGAAQSPSQIAAAIDSVTTADVNAVSFFFDK